jgi:hypothetical protein
MSPAWSPKQLIQEESETGSQLSLRLFPELVVGHLEIPASVAIQDVLRERASHSTAVLQALS